MKMIGIFCRAPSHILKLQPLIPGICIIGYQAGRFLEDVRVPGTPSRKAKARRAAPADLIRLAAAMRMGVVVINVCDQWND